MREASKTNQHRSPAFATQYLQGKVIDIGAGADPVCPSALVFDQQHGDANHLDRYFEKHSFDTVHSSHCLEHMHHPAAALATWWPLVKPGGYLIVVVPDEELYEQGIWPSFFNPDHKNSFRLNRSQGLTPVSHDLGDLCRRLENAEVVSATRHDLHFNHELIFAQGRAPRRIRYPLKLVHSILKRSTRFESPLRVAFHKWLVAHGYPIDQTHGDALAQIEVIVRKQA